MLDIGVTEVQAQTLKLNDQFSREFKAEWEALAKVSGYYPRVRV